MTKKNQKGRYGLKVKRYKVVPQPETSAASSTAGVSFTPTPPMLTVDNLGRARLNWAGQVTVWKHDNVLYISANGIRIRIDNP